MKRALSIGSLLLVLQLAASGVSAAWAQAGFDIVPVKRRGDPVIAPATLISASEPTLSDAGGVLFRGDGGLLLASSEGHIVVAAPGDVTPDGRVIEAIGDASVNAQGQVAFVASFGPSESALFLYSEGTTTAIAESSLRPPPPLRFALRSPSLDAHGRVAFIDDRRILLYAEGAVNELVHIDHPALVGFWFVDVRLNDAGRVVFATGSTGPRNSISPLGVYLIANGEVRAIAQFGSVAPDGSTFALAGFPSMNAGGDVAFWGILSSPFGGPSGIFVFSDGNLTEIVRSGDVVGEFTLGGPGLPAIDNEGQVAFDAYIGALSRRVVFLFSAGLVRPLVVPGEKTSEGDVVVEASAPSFNAHGQLAFVDSGGLFDRVYRVTDEGISRVAQQGDVVSGKPRVVSASTSVAERIGQPVFEASIFPGTTGIFDVNGALRVRIGGAVPGGAVIVGINQLTSNEVGTIAFMADLPGLGSGIFLSRQDGTLTEVIRADTFSSVSGPSVNAAGEVAFSSRSLSSGGIFLASDGAIWPVVRVGDSAPGGGEFTEVTNPSLNDSGQVAFLGSVSSPGRSGVFVASADGVRTIVSVGDPAPGGGNFSNFSFPHLNVAGQVAFASSPLPASEVSGVFLFSPHEGIRSVMRDGDPAPGGGTFAGSSRLTLDDRGRVAFASPVLDPSGTGAFLFTDGNLEVIARSSDSAPEGDTFTSVSDPKLGTNGGILFTATTSSTGTEVFFARRPTQLLHVRMDIRPGRLANRIDPASDRNVQVAMLSDEVFDVRSVVADTVRFGATGTEAAPVTSVFRDVDGDGDIDGVLRFRIQDTDIQCEQTSALLTGQTSNGDTFAASDTIRTIRCR
jgi:hypothetical protein